MRWQCRFMQARSTLTDFELRAVHVAVDGGRWAGAVTLALGSRCRRACWRASPGAQGVGSRPCKSRGAADAAAGGVWARSKPLCSKKLCAPVLRGLAERRRWRAEQRRGR